MDFDELGVLEYATPSDELSMNITLFRSFGPHTAKLLTKDDVMKWVVKGTRNIKDPSEKEAAAKRYLDMYVITILAGKEKITEEEFVNNWMNFAFSDETEKKKHMHEIMTYMVDLFQAVDSNRDGTIDFDEFIAFYDIYGFNTSTTARMVFDILDVSKDGLISANEFAYAKLSFLMCCGPDSPIRFFYGPMAEE